MVVNRKPYQGVVNILRFNWDYFAIGICVIAIAGFLLPYLFSHYSVILYLAAAFMLSMMIISVLTSYWVYDRSGLYEFKWMERLSREDNEKMSERLTIANINAGFDETSEMIKEKFSRAEVITFDFYNPLKHTEKSIKRARKIYPNNSTVVIIDTSSPKLGVQKFDLIFLILSAHEIRQMKERIDFFISLKQSLNVNGKIFVVEHLRDLPNFLAYSIGFLHFHSKMKWRYTFKAAGFKHSNELKLNPFISLFEINR